MKSPRKFGALPDPNAFKSLMQSIPHYASDYWHGIFEETVYREVAADLLQGSSLVTDLDFTAYAHDAGFTLLEAAIHAGFIQGEKLSLYRKTFSDYEALPASRSLQEKTRNEFAFYCETLKFFAEIKLSDLKELSRQMWLHSIPGFHERHGLIHYIYPEMAYLYALAVRGGKQKGQGLVAVSASPNFAIEPAFPALNLTLDRLCSMDLTINSKGLVTREIPRPVHGKLKVHVAKTVLPAWDYAAGDNPRNDLAFLQAARKRGLGVGKEIKLLEGTMNNLFCLALKSPPITDS